MLSAAYVLAASARPVVASVWQQKKLQLATLLGCVGRDGPVVDVLVDDDDVVDVVVDEDVLVLDVVDVVVDEDVLVLDVVVDEDALVLDVEVDVEVDVDEVAEPLSILYNSSRFPAPQYWKGLP